MGWMTGLSRMNHARPGRGSTTTMRSGYSNAMPRVGSRSTKIGRATARPKYARASARPSIGRLGGRKKFF